MAVGKIFEVCLYTTDIVNSEECHLAAAWMDHSGIPYVRLNYNDETQHSKVFDALNTWWEGKTVSHWPFIVYRMRPESNDPSASPVSQYIISDFIEGLEDIKAKMPELAPLIEIQK